MTACNKHRALSKYNLDEAFYSFDSYQKSYVTFDDFENAFGKYEDHGVNIWEDIIKEGIDDEEGLIDLESFHKMMAKMLIPWNLNALMLIFLKLLNPTPN